MKKLVLSLISVLVALTSAAHAFTFPEPDWTQLLNEKKAMVSETDFELYTEGSAAGAPYYGAKFEPRSGAYIGMIAEYSDQFHPLGGYLTYIDDMYQDDFYWPARDMIKSDNVITTVGWTINNINAVDYSQLRSVLDKLNSYNKPMFIRFANEMNVSDLGADPDKYIEVFRNAANIIHEYPNFAVVWSPNDLGALDRPFEYFYPGDEYVDWVGVSCYSIMYFQGDRNAEKVSRTYFMTGDYAWATNRLKPIVEFMDRNNIQKPIMISEGGVTTANQYNENCESWASPRLRNMLYNVIMKYPQVKLINYFNTHRANEAETFDIGNFPYACNIFREAAESGAYIRALDDTPEFTYVPASNGETLTAKNGMVSLHTLAYIENQPDIAVNYTLDDRWYHGSTQIPYTCNLDISTLSDGAHTLQISASGISKSYTFYKLGQNIRFGAMPEQIIRVTLNGTEIEFDQPPVIADGRTLVPLRAIFNALGATVEWDPDTQTVSSKRGGKQIKLTIGSNKMTVDGVEKILDVPAQIIGGRTLVPARAIVESFDCNVSWDDASKTVIITE